MNEDPYRDRLAAWLDGEIPEPDATSLAVHLETCDACRRYADELTALERRLCPRREETLSVAESVANAVVEQLSDLPRERAQASSTKRWDGSKFMIWLVGLATGLLVTTILPRDTPSSDKTVAPFDLVTEREATTHPKEKRHPTMVGKLNDVIGDVSLDEVSIVNPAILSLFNCPTDSVIETGIDSRCEVELAEGSIVRLGDRTKVVLRSSREIEIQNGQLFCNSASASELRVRVAPRRQPSPENPTATPFESLLTCAPQGSLLTRMELTGTQITSASGKVDLTTAQSTISLREGESVRVVEDQIVPVARRGEDPLLATGWIHPLLIRKGPRDRELNARVDALLAQVGRSKLSHLYESEIRSLGEHCVLPLIRYLQLPEAEIDPAKRIVAARIVEDLATTRAIGDLIDLLGATEGSVRVAAAGALQRLTGTTHGIEPHEWFSDIPSAGLSDWRSWWESHRSVYPAWERQHLDPEKTL